MPGFEVHHVSIVVSDLERSIDFYRSLFDLPRLARPPFSMPGAWLGCDNLEIHLIHNPGGSFRAAASIDNDDWHFAFRTDDFEGFVDSLHRKGFHEDAAEGDPTRLVVMRDSVAGFPQLYLCDPDHNVVEINGAPSHTARPVSARGESVTRP